MQAHIRRIDTRNRGQTLSRTEMALIFALLIGAFALLIATSDGSYMHAWFTGQCFGDHPAKECSKNIRVRGRYAPLNP
jgi:hypothetical protein